MQSIAEMSKENKLELEVVQNTGEILIDITDSGKKISWEKYKANSKDLAKLFRLAQKQDESIISDSRLQSLNECASFLLFDRDIERKHRLRHANFCRLRLCPMCSWRKSLKLFGQVSEIATELLHQRPSVRFLFVTLTVPNCKAEDLSNKINSMNKAFTCLTCKGKKFVPAKTFKKNLLGYMKAIEITYNQKTDTYHPHIHCLFAVKSSYFVGTEYIRKGKWQEIWTQAMHSECELIVHVETINSKVKSIAEMSKYPVKPTDLLSIKDKEQAVRALMVLHKTLKGRRLVTFGGLLAEIKKALNLEDVDAGNADLIHVDSQKPFVPIEQVLYRWCKIGAYVC